MSQVRGVDAELHAWQSRLFPNVVRCDEQRKEKSTLLAGELQSHVRVPLRPLSGASPQLDALRVEQVYRGWGQSF